MSEINLKVKTSDNKIHEIKILDTGKISEIKEDLEGRIGVPIEQQKLIYAGKVLKDEDSVEGSKLKEGHTIHLVKSGKAKSNHLYLLFSC